MASGGTLPLVNTSLSRQEPRDKPSWDLPAEAGIPLPSAKEQCSGSAAHPDSLLQRQDFSRKDMHVTNRDEKVAQCH